MKRNAIGRISLRVRSWALESRRNSAVTRFTRLCLALLVSSSLLTSLVYPSPRVTGLRPPLLGP